MVTVKTIANDLYSVQYVNHSVSRCLMDRDIVIMEEITPSRIEMFHHKINIQICSNFPLRGKWTLTITSKTFPTERLNYQFYRLQIYTHLHFVIYILYSTCMYM